ncbi:PepSY domain-containing protein [Peptostreptococcus sp. D1]|uniref:PepSY domain-containing protein n=1 Tax=Peptostreptococcus sp. D1 TaxID=72304 RepID=UPI0008F4332A|nr:PepSY domain-containing protein [Peptostreptococcus sp. D1]SFE23438.1 Peptidase propeptide and YPEB domain-containing protein [Peptostreptococcus sp. D1]
MKMKKNNVKKSSIIALALVGMLAASNIPSFAAQAQATDSSSTSATSGATNSSSTAKSSNSTDNSGSKSSTSSAKSKKSKNTSSTANANSNSAKANKSSSTNSGSKRKKGKGSRAEQGNKSKISLDEKIAQANVKITKEQAQKIAQEAVSGSTVEKIFFKNKDNQPRYKIIVTKDNVRYAVKLDANTGSIISNQTETASDKAEKNRARKNKNNDSQSNSNTTKNLMKSESKSANTRQSATDEAQAE